jgi:hypothetical protein
MSIGGSIPYHLRQNKAIDRNLFTDLLSRIGRYKNISDYTYYGFGGPYMEDFKHLHGALRLQDMVSIEREREVVKRQRFNQPLACVRILEGASGDFIARFDPETPSVVWLDYTEPKDIGIQLVELQQLVSKLNPYDVVKITLNAAASALGEPKEADKDLKEYRLEVARERIGGFLPAHAGNDDVTGKNYPGLLLQAIHLAEHKGMEGRRAWMLQPLSAFTYADGQPMVTATAIVLPKSDIDAFFSHTRLKHWPYVSVDWSAPRSISVPDLSLRERLKVEAMLPSASSKDILDALGYRIAATPAESEELMENFVRYYRMYPLYSRVIV